jgi:hypothetical protein
MAKAERVVADDEQGHDEAMTRLKEIPNVGPRMAEALLRLGVSRLEDAAGRDPDEMYHELCAMDAKGHDPCVRDVFAAVVSHAEGGPARPWWEFTPERKARARAAEDRAAREEKAGRERS